MNEGKWTIGIESTAHTFSFGLVDPNGIPYPSVGDTIKPGDVLCIIEAMKVMNPIKAEKSGTITQILVENGEPVEFGDVLMVIE